ncbi:hypothetical protein NQ317_019575 [Molorchus minor]|uniref:SNF2 N-terminal domain-containing protein n=1 Tax=Molorchus minor TaxID=1323400 RepID=A0ABQ9K055_9CUCU|nr:hypothetical protein NQ317_019575 [Molorchus minor]
MVQVHFARKERKQRMWGLDTRAEALIEPVWKRWVGNKSTGGQERLHTVISSLMLRRTKAELIEKGSLTTLPERKWELIPIDLSKGEMDIYQKNSYIFKNTFCTVSTSEGRKEPGPY